MKNLFYLFLLAVFISSIAYVSACTPAYQCADWGSCSEGLQTRNCTDTLCGMPDTIERRLCSSNEETCTVKLSCSDWTPCSYLDKTDDILTSNIRFKGYQERSCADLNGCADSFVEQRSCEDSFKVKFVQVEQCGVPYLVALDENSHRSVSEVNLDAWKNKRLDISFIQSNFTYCPSCYNGFQDADEQGIDCGGSCKACVDEHGITTQTLLISSTWFASLAIFSGFIFASFFDRRTRARYLIYRAYKALDARDRPALLRNVKKLKEQYKAMTPSQRAALDKELERLYRRV